MTGRFDDRSHHRAEVARDLEALALAVGVLAVVLGLCLVAAISPRSI